jgi:hypothetical protein
MTDAGLVQRRSGSFCDKIVRRHQDRLAIVYVRQSTAQQVERHQESTKLQYALADRAAQFGWLREQISAWRCRGWRAPTGIGISFWRSARCSTR